MRTAAVFVLAAASVACAVRLPAAQSAARAAVKPVAPPPGLSLPAKLPDTEWGREYACLANDIRDRDEVVRRADQAFRRETLIAETDRDPADVVLRRTEALLADLRGRHGDGAGRLALGQELAALRRQAAATPPIDGAARYELYERVCRLRRRIAFGNPLLDFREILFLKRNGLGGRHMCDQYYGQDQAPGGAVCVISDPFGTAPQVREPLADSVVANGRLQGKRLAGGSFLSPALSFDARRMAFAYVECEGPKGHEQHTDPTRGHWPLGWSYHVFAANLDGTDLRMLTDGAWNEFSPCFMPSGRIAFISERRGGYLRCGRVCPTYTLFDMAADGSDIRCLSYHETNEWSPSLTPDGMILWTRWDYVDRHGCVTHMPWITTPDGRNPRPVHGNYAPRNIRPDMEIDARAIPGSRRFVATAAPHHGFAFGSFVVVDPDVKDDDGMAPVKRMTPHVPFPESERGRRSATPTYGQAWPLSEDYHLCVSRTGGKEPFGLYLLDTFGNQELIYRDPALHSLSPIPLRSQQTPPVVPELARPAADKSATEAVVGVMDVYDSSSPWPAGTTISALRVFQIFPLSLPSAAVMGRHEAGPRIPQASDSVNLTRAALGTVPVEKDGSAHFIVPAGRELFFQALDENGLAVTSMRSGTHFLPGERAMCQGCHEPEHRSPPTAATSTRLALLRAPSRLQPEVEGSNPVSYPRLVQPVLDKHCVACHAKEAGRKAPPLDSSVAKTRGTPYYASFTSLVYKYGFYSYPDRYRSTPGQFGARASKLYELLRKGHHDVTLSAGEMRRITLWLDSVSLFYGVYEPEGQQTELAGKAVRPTLE